MNLASKSLAFLSVLAAVVMLTSSLAPMVRGDQTEPGDVLAASTFLGSGGQVSIADTATAPDGTVYAVGHVTAGTLPTTFGAYDRTRSGIDGFVARFSADLSTLLASTYLGGSNEDRCTDVTVSSEGSVLVAGYTLSNNFPTTDGAYDRTWGGSGKADVFVSELSSDLTVLAASTFLGSGDGERPSSIALAGSGIVVAGTTSSAAFPTTAGAYDTSHNGGSDGFVSALSDDLASLLSSTFVGSSADDTLDAMAVFDDQVYLTGSTAGTFPTTFGSYDRTRGGVDAFVSCMPADLGDLTASTYLGGSNAEHGAALAADASGVYVAGSTASGSFPTTDGAYDRTFNGGGSDAFLSKLSTSLGSLLASTFLGGGAYDRALGLTIASNEAFVVGESRSANFPVSADAYDATSNGMSDATMTHLDATFSSLLHSTYLGGGEGDLASSAVVSPEGGIIMTGSTRSADFPVIAGYDLTYNGGASGSDGFLAWMDIGGEATHKPVADFSADVTSGDAPLTVQFTDISTNSPTAWEWDIENDGTVDSTEQNPSFTYTAAGTYSVKLTVSNSAGSDTETKTDLIVVSEEASTWENFHGDDALTGYAVGAAPHTNNVKWQVDCNAIASSGIAIGEGMAFVLCGEGSGWSITSGNLKAFDLENGDLVWNVTVDPPDWGSWSSPCYDQGMVFVSSGPYTYAFAAADGTSVWTFTNPSGRSSCNGGPMVADGKVFCSDWDGSNYYCLDKNSGALIWTFTVSGYAQATPAYHDGNVFLTSWPYQASPSAGYLYCVNADTGTMIWTATSGSSSQHFCASPCVAGGHVYVTSYNFYGDGGFYCFREDDGELVWQRTVQRSDSTPAYHDGRVYIAGGCPGESYLQTYCFDAATGAPIWSTAEEQEIGGWTCSISIADGLVFVGKQKDYFQYAGTCALDAATGAVVWSHSQGGASPAVWDGMVLTAGEGELIVFATIADWPSFQGDNYNSGLTSDRTPIASPTLLWDNHTSSSGMAGFDVAPIVVDDVVYMIDYQGYVQAYDLDNGNRLWQVRPATGGGMGFQLSTPAYANGVLYVAILDTTNYPSAFAIDASDGSVIWSHLGLGGKFSQPNTPVVYDDGRVYFGIWYSNTNPGQYFCLNAIDGTTVWEREATSGSYYWAGAAVIGDYLVYGEDSGNLVSVNKATGATVQELLLNSIYGIANANIRSSVCYSEDTGRIYFAAKTSHCCALGFNAATGMFDTTDKWCTPIGYSTSTPAVYGGQVYIGSGDHGTERTMNMHCLNEADGVQIWNLTINGGVQASPVISTYYDNGDGEAYIYFTTNCENGTAYCVDMDGNVKWTYEPEAGKTQWLLQGVAIYDGKVVFGNDAGYLFCLGGN